MDKNRLKFIHQYPICFAERDTTKVNVKDFIDLHTPPPLLLRKQMLVKVSDRRPLAINTP